jgi:hypothetical protein
VDRRLLSPDRARLDLSTVQQTQRNSTVLAAWPSTAQETSLSPTQAITPFGRSQTLGLSTRLRAEPWVLWTGKVPQHSSIRPSVLPSPPLGSSSWPTRTTTKSVSFWPPGKSSPSLAQLRGSPTAQPPTHNSTSQRQSRSMAPVGFTSLITRMLESARLWTPYALVKAAPVRPLAPISPATALAPNSSTEA